MTAAAVSPGATPYRSTPRSALVATGPHRRAVARRRAPAAWSTGRSRGHRRPVRRHRRARPRTAGCSRASPPTASDAEQRALIGPPPRGHGILGLVIREAQADPAPRPDAAPRLLRLPARTIRRCTPSSASRSSGRRGVFGNLYLTEKLGGEASPTRTSTSRCCSRRIRPPRWRTPGCTRRAPGCWRRCSSSTAPGSGSSPW